MADVVQWRSRRTVIQKKRREANKQKAMVKWKGLDEPSLYASSSTFFS